MRHGQCHGVTKEVKCRKQLRGVVHVANEAGCFVLYYFVVFAFLCHCCQFVYVSPHDELQFLVTDTPSCLRGQNDCSEVRVPANYFEQWRVVRTLVAL